MITLNIDILSLIVQTNTFLPAVWFDLIKVREAIDYDGEVLKAILEKPAFRQMFGGLYEDEKLQRMPKGYGADHPHADLLKYKTFAVVRPISRKQVLSPGFEDLVEATYLEMLPLRRYLNRALTVDA